MINRLCYGYTPSLQKAIGQAGGPREWFDAQLNPSRIAVKNADAMKAWVPYLRSSSRITDYRGVLSEVVKARFPEASLPSVFPGFAAGSSLGVMR